MAFAHSSFFEWTFLTNHIIMNYGINRLNFIYIKLIVENIRLWCNKIPDFMVSRKLTRIVHNVSSKKIPKRIKRSKAWRINVVLRYVSVLRSTTYQRIKPSLPEWLRPEIKFLLNINFNTYLTQLNHYLCFC